MATLTLNSLHLFSRMRWLVAALLLCLPSLGLSSEPSAEAVLETHAALPNEPVQLEISVQGGQRITAPEIEVEGLEISYIGQQRRVTSQNFGPLQSSVIYHYEVIPRRTGEFTIPAQDFRIDGKTISTKPVKLTVNRSGTAPGGEENEAADSAHPRISMEWVVPKTTLYVGEIIPAELRVYLPHGVRVRLTEMPKLKSDGLTLREFPREPQVNSTERNGQGYDVIVFKTAISAAKIGQLKLEQTVMNVNVEVQERRPSRRRGFGSMPDVFNDPFFQQVRMRKATITAPEVELEVKSLPNEGRPADFSGAVGQFRLSTKASPVKGRAGDPITVTSVVSGRGNFQRMNAPAIESVDGWQFYPPSSRFEADDDIEISGEKTFEQAAIPDHPAKVLPRISFSYFDPVQEKYLTVAGDPIPLEITGTAAAPTPTPSVAAATSPSPAQPQATPATPAASNDILFVRTDGVGKIGSFLPAWRSPLFLGLQLVPLAALIAGAWVQWKKRSESDIVGKRRSRLRSERQAAARALRDSSLPAGRFYEEAVKAFQLTVALERGSEASVDGGGGIGIIGAEEVCQGRSLSAGAEDAINGAFQQLDELRYAGGAGAVAAPVTPERRSAILAAFEELEKLEKSHAR